MEELSYTSKYDGETTDDILDYANAGKTEQVNEYVQNMKEQDSEGEPDTVQIFDTDGVPHKVSKTELLKKSTLALPKLEDISAFVAVNAKGDAVGVMTKEDIAKVLAELMGVNICLKQKLQCISGNADDYKDIGIYDFQQNSPTFTNIPLNFGTMIVYGGGTDYGYKTQLVSSIESGESYIRTLYGGIWSPWKKITP